MSTQSHELVPFKQKVVTVREMFKARQKQMAATLPSYLTPERLTTLALAAAQNTPKLLECTPMSFVQAVIQAGRLGLEPDGLLGHAYLIPYKGTVTLVPGYKGLLKLARNSGQIATIQAHEVYANDKFTFHYGLDPKLEHTPTPDAPGAIVAFYAVARLKDGSTQFEVMWNRQVLEIRDSSQGYKAAKQYNKTTPWETHYAEMGKKTVLRRLCKMLPSSVELQKAVALDEQADAGVPQEFEFIDVPAEEAGEGSGEQGVPSKLDALIDADKGKSSSAPTPPTPPKQPDAPRPAAQEKPKSSGKAKPQPEPPAQPGPSYSDSEPDPFAPGGELFGQREPGSDDR